MDCPFEKAKERDFTEGEKALGEMGEEGGERGGMVGEETC